MVSCWLLLFSLIFILEIRILIIFLPNIIFHSSVFYHEHQIYTEVCENMDINYQDIYLIYTSNDWTHQ